jgi:hypothetical protein
MIVLPIRQCISDIQQLVFITAQEKQNIPEEWCLLGCYAVWLL